jgi:TorA maturation chaperone TorD
LAAAAADRGNLYSFLAAVFRKPLSAGMLREIRSTPFAEALPAAGVELGPGFFEAPETRLLEELAVDFTQLFHGPRDHIAPYESIHTARDGGELNGKAARLVRDCIEAAGFTVDPAAGELPDHIGVELEFMSEMAREEAGAWEKGDLAGAQNCLARQDAFVKAHLQEWVPEFCDKVRERASTRFYGEIAQLLRGLVELELSEPELRLQGDLRQTGPDNPTDPEALAARPRPADTGSSRERA